MRLVDADKLKNILQNLSYDDWNQDITAEAYLETVDAIENAPTVDAEPIRHGHWEEHPLDWEQRVCSICGGAAETITYHLKDGRVRLRGTPYCPYCGALMEEEVEEDE